VFWVPVAAWGAALVVGVVLLGYCAYEIRWKAKRLTGDLNRLQALGADLHRLQVELAAVQERADAAQRSLPTGSR
jgi:hypothetical protein